MNMKKLTAAALVGLITLSMTVTPAFAITSMKNKELSKRYEEGPREPEGPEEPEGPAIPEEPLTKRFGIFASESLELR